MIRINQLSSHRDTLLISNVREDYGFASIRGQNVDSVIARIKALEQTSSLHGLNQAILRTRKTYLLEGFSLHVFVVTARCDHNCGYCQVSRASENASSFDMTEDDAIRALETVFQSPAEVITIEFPGGEPTLRLDLGRKIVGDAKQRNQAENRR